MRRRSTSAPRSTPGVATSPVCDVRCHHVCGHVRRGEAGSPCPAWRPCPAGPWSVLGTGSEQAACSVANAPRRSRYSATSATLQAGDQPTGRSSLGRSSLVRGACVARQAQKRRSRSSIRPGDRPEGHLPPPPDVAGLWRGARCASRATASPARPRRPAGPRSGSGPSPPGSAGGTGSPTAGGPGRARPRAARTAAPSRRRACGMAPISARV